MRLITATVFAAKSDGHIDDHERANIETQLRAANIDVQARVLIDRRWPSRWIRSVSPRASSTRRRRWRSTTSAAR
nr:Inner membrane protein yebE [Klebsiella pneumoniae]